MPNASDPAGFPAPRRTAPKPSVCRAAAPTQKPAPRMMELRTKRRTGARSAFSRSGRVFAPLRRNISLGRAPPGTGETPRPGFARRSLQTANACFARVPPIHPPGAAERTRGGVHEARTARPSCVGRDQQHRKRPRPQRLGLNAGRLRPNRGRSGRWNQEWATVPRETPQTRRPAGLRALFRLYFPCTWWQTIADQERPRPKHQQCIFVTIAPADRGPSPAHKLSCPAPTRRSSIHEHLRFRFALAVAFSTADSVTGPGCERASVARP